MRGVAEERGQLVSPKGSACPLNYRNPLILRSSLGEHSHGTYMFSSVNIWKGVSTYLFPGHLVTNIPTGPLPVSDHPSTAHEIDRPIPLDISPCGHNTTRCGVQGSAHRKDFPSSLSFRGGPECGRSASAVCFQRCLHSAQQYLQARLGFLPVQPRVLGNSPGGHGCGRRERM